MRSYDLPLISGFYKLLTYALKTCEKEGILDERPTRRGTAVARKLPPCADEVGAEEDKPFAVGECVEYLSATQNTWMPAVVKDLADDAGRVHLDVKKSTPWPSQRLHESTSRRIVHLALARSRSNSHHTGAVSKVLWMRCESCNTAIYLQMPTGCAFEDRN